MDEKIQHIKQTISGSLCSRCGGPAPDWKCPKCGVAGKSFDPNHWRKCREGGKMQAQCLQCGEAEENCTCV